MVHLIARWRVFFSVGFVASCTGFLVLGAGVVSSVFFLVVSSLCHLLVDLEHLVEAVLVG